MLRLDLKAHRLAGAAAGALAHAALAVTGVYLPFVGTLAAGTAGSANEVYDSKGHGTVDKRDFWYTTLGGVLVDVVVLFLRTIVLQ